jgi:O-antigen/teichoic acid export membrane protein
MRWVAAIGAAHVTLVVALGVLAISAGGGLWAVYIAAFAAGACRTVAFWTALRHCGWLPAFPVDRATVRRLFTGGLPLGVSAFLSLAFLHADKLATTTIIGAAATGQLVAAFVVVFGVVEVIGNTALVAAFPLMARAGGEASPARMHSIVLRLLSFDAFAALPATASLVVFGPAIASIFGQEFGGVAGLWSVMGWFILVHMAEGVLAQALIVRDRQTDVLFTRGGGLLLNLTVAVMLLPRIGVMGAAMGMLVGDAAVVGMMVGLLHPPAEWWRRMAREAMGVAAAGAVLFGVLLVLRPHVNMSVAILAALALYGGAAVAAGAARNVWTP